MRKLLALLAAAGGAVAAYFRWRGARESALPSGSRPETGAPTDAAAAPPSESTAPSAPTVSPPGSGGDSPIAGTEQRSAGDEERMQREHESRATDETQYERAAEEESAERARAADRVRDDPLAERLGGT